MFTIEAGHNRCSLLKIADAHHSYLSYPFKKGREKNLLRGMYTGWQDFTDNVKNQPQAGVRLGVPKCSVARQTPVK